MSKYDQCHSGKEQQYKENILQYWGWGTAVLLLQWSFDLYAKSLWLYRHARWVESWVFVYLLLLVLLQSSTPPPRPPTPSPPWNPRPSLKEKWRIWHVLQLTGKLTLCLLETCHTTPRWVLPFPPGHPYRLCPLEDNHRIPPTRNTDGRERTTQAGAGRAISARGEQTGSRRVLVSHLVSEIPHRASLYFGRV